MINSDAAEWFVDPKLLAKKERDALADTDLPFESIDLNPSNPISAINGDNIHNKDKGPSKLSKLSDSIRNKVNSAKVKKRGFQKVGNDEYDETLSPSKDVAVAVHQSSGMGSVTPSCFEITICNKTCRCTKGKCIIFIAFLSAIFLFLIIMAKVKWLSKSSGNNTGMSSNCMNGRRLLIISLDGFRAEYLDRIPTPNIDSYFIERGVSVKGMNPVYPSKV